MVTCRGCKTQVFSTFLNLGSSPIANDLILKENLNEPEVHYPLHVMTCSNCSLVQLPEVTSREALFRSDYVYFSSFSSTWLEHSQRYVTQMIELLELNSNDLVIEIASNDGYLLQYFKQRDIKVLGVEPSSGVAKVATEKGIPTLIDFFGEQLALELARNVKPKLMVGNNVLAHVPNLHDFIKGFAVLIAENGIITFEFPHLVSLIKNNQFDTIYHEHYSYLTITSLSPIFALNGLKIIDVKKLSTHGGSIRIYVSLSTSAWRTNDSVTKVLQEESEYDPRNALVSEPLQARTLKLKIDLLEETIRCRREGLKIAAYGAAAKGNTLLNFVGIDSDLIDYVVDLNPFKQGNYLPGSRIPVVGVEELSRNTPDILLVLPWNLAEEVKAQMTEFISNGMKLLRAVPRVEYF